MRQWISLIPASASLAGLLLAGSAVTAVRAQQDSRNPVLRALTGGDSSTTIHTVVVEMGEVVLNIPRNYFRIMPVHDIAGRPEAVQFSMDMLLPGFEPRSEETRSEFDRPGWGRKISVFITFRGHTLTGTALFQAYYRRKGEAPILQAELGYQSFHWLGSDRLFRGTTDDPKDYVVCAPKELSINKNRATPLPWSPSCGRIVRVAPDIVVDYKFAREFLGDVPDIEKNLLAALNRFRVAGPALTLLE